ncbi:MAG: shikimate dehydrogenase [Burkholderiales bacterium]|nr:MAG: shikimate dehydrogenase [Burkholderiales bacterium]
MTDHYAVIGNPIAQSKSPEIHTMFARATGQDIVYTKLEAPLDGFSDAVLRFRAAGGRGMNVTAPFKLQALAMATRTRPAAWAAGAANTLRFDGEQIEADNFDGLGLVRDLVHNHSMPIAGRRVLLLGAGGAVRGALHPLLEEGPARVLVVNRTVEKARKVVEELGHEPRVAWCGYPDVGDECFDIVIDGTSASLRGELPPIRASVFGPDAMAYEMVYGKGLTPFLKLAKTAGITRLADGVGMLIEQAAEAFNWWRGVRPDTRAVIDKLTVALV